MGIGLTMMSRWVFIFPHDSKNSLSDTYFGILSIDKACKWMQYSHLHSFSTSSTHFMQQWAHHKLATSMSSGVGPCWYIVYKLLLWSKSKHFSLNSKNPLLFPFFYSCNRLTNWLYLWLCQDCQQYCHLAMQWAVLKGQAIMGNAGKNFNLTACIKWENMRCLTDLSPNLCKINLSSPHIHSILQPGTTLQYLAVKRIMNKVVPHVPLCSCIKKIFCQSGYDNLLKINSLWFYF